ncbi:MAG: Rne/Rng family ribonuclease [Acidimicrobiales bacterium]
MLDPTAGHPASVPDAPERATDAPEAPSSARKSELASPFAGAASATVVPPRPKIGDSRPAPPVPKVPEAAQPRSGSGRRGQPPASSQQPEPQRTREGGTVGPAAGTGTSGGGSSRRRRGRRGRSRASASGIGSNAADAEANTAGLDDSAADTGAGPVRAATARAHRARGGEKLGELAAPPRRVSAVAGVGTSTQPASSQGPAAPDGAQVQRPGRDRRGRLVGRYLMCVHVELGATHIAVLEGRALIEHFVARPQDDANQIVGNIYRGRVKNVLPGMEAAFVDIGTPKNAVLYWGDVAYERDDVERQAGADRIEHLLRPGQTIVCQVTKNPIGMKGARLTQEVSIPGRFVVLVPESTTYGISRRLDDSERRRLRRILDEVRPEGHGLIVRTAAAGASAEDLRRDVEQLVGRWREIDERTRKLPAPALLYSEPHMAVRIIREELTDEHRSVLIDDPELFVIVRDYVSQFNPELAERVELYDLSTEALPLFERHHVHEQLHKALDRKVWLPSGGSLIIERTEALTVIDVNTGKNVGSSSLEETVFENNLEAAEEIARQLRLRDIGGIIVIDFVDMELKANRTSVLAAFKAALARDKTPTQVYEISDLGLVEMTRKRVGEGLVEALSETCPTCSGRGIVFPDQHS